MQFKFDIISFLRMMMRLLIIQSDNFWAWLFCCSILTIVKCYCCLVESSALDLLVLEWRFPVEVQQKGSDPAGVALGSWLFVQFNFLINFMVRLKCIVYCFMYSNCLMYSYNFIVLIVDSLNLNYMIKYFPVSLWSFI